MSWPLVVTSDTAETTRDLAARVARLVRTGDVVLLIGDLGAGKTVFAQGFAKGLGIEGPVTSPTFALVRQYACAPSAPVSTLLHADIYRTESLPEVVDLALGELVEDDAVAVIEWGDRAAPVLGKNALEITLTVEDAEGADGRRRITVLGRGAWSDRSEEMEAAWPEAREGASR